MNFQSVKVLPFTFIIVLSRNDFPQTTRLVCQELENLRILFFSNSLILDRILAYAGAFSIVPLIGIPFVFQTGGTEVQQQPQLVIAHM